LQALTGRTWIAFLIVGFCWAALHSRLAIPDLPLPRLSSRRPGHDADLSAHAEAGAADCRALAHGYCGCNHDRYLLMKKGTTEQMPAWIYGFPPSRRKKAAFKIRPDLHRTCVQIVCIATEIVPFSKLPDPMASVFFGIDTIGHSPPPRPRIDPGLPFGFILGDFARSEMHSGLPVHGSC